MKFLYNTKKDHYGTHVHPLQHGMWECEKCGEKKERVNTHVRKNHSCGCVLRGPRQTNNKGCGEDLHKLFYEVIASLSLPETMKEHVKCVAQAVLMVEEIKVLGFDNV